MSRETEGRAPVRQETDHARRVVRTGEKKRGFRRERRYVDSGRKESILDLRHQRSTCARRLNATRVLIRIQSERWQLEELTAGVDVMEEEGGLTGVRIRCAMFRGGEE